MEAVKWDPFDKGHAGNKSLGLSTLVSAVIDGQGAVNGQVQRVDVFGYYTKPGVSRIFISTTEKTKLLTRWFVQGSSVFDIEVWECAVDMSAHLLAGLGRPKHANDGHFGLLVRLQAVIIPTQVRVISCWCGLVVVDAVESNPEPVHLDCVVQFPRRATRHGDMLSFFS